jgi:hypothetical protein
MGQRCTRRSSESLRLRLRRRLRQQSLRQRRAAWASGAAFVSKVPRRYLERKDLEVSVVPAPLGQVLTAWT